MKKKIIILSVFVLTICLFLGGCKSSNDNITNDDYFTMIEVLVTDGPNFSLVINKDNVVSHILFLNNKSTFLSDSKVEGKGIDKAISIVMEQIWNKDYFNSNKDIELINYGDNEIYNKFYQEVNKNLVILGINGSVIKNESTLEEKSILLDISYEGELEFLNELKVYSNKLVKE